MVDFLLMLIERFSIGVTAEAIRMGATTVRTAGETGPPNFLAVVFKKQEILQQLFTRMQDSSSEFS